MGPPDYACFWRNLPSRQANDCPLSGRHEVDPYDRDAGAKLKSIPLFAQTRSRRRDVVRSSLPAIRRMLPFSDIEIGMARYFGTDN